MNEHEIRFLKAKNTLYAGVCGGLSAFATDNFFWTMALCVLLVIGVHVVALLWTER